MEFSCPIMAISNNVKYLAWPPMTTPEWCQFPTKPMLYFQPYTHLLSSQVTWSTSILETGSSSGCLSSKLPFWSVETYIPIHFPEQTGDDLTYPIQTPAATAEEGCRLRPVSYLTVYADIVSVWCVPHCARRQCVDNLTKSSQETSTIWRAEPLSGLPPWQHYRCLFQLT